MPKGSSPPPMHVVPSRTPSIFCLAAGEASVFAVRAEASERGLSAASAARWGLRGDSPLPTMPSSTFPNPPLRSLDMRISALLPANDSMTIRSTVAEGPRPSTTAR